MKNFEEQFKKIFTEPEKRLSERKREIKEKRAEDRAKFESYRKEAEFLCANINSQNEVTK